MSEKGSVTLLRSSFLQNGHEMVMNYNKCCKNAWFERRVDFSSLSLAISPKARIFKASGDFFMPS